MSTGNDSSQVISTAYYDYMKETLAVASVLTERLIFMEESGLASNANLLRSQLSQMVEQDLSDQVSTIPLPSFDA